MTATTDNLEVHEPVKIRDVRVDHLGFVRELTKHFDEKVKPLIKSTMADKSAERACGDCFEAVVVCGEVETIDPDKFLRAFEKKQITRAQFLAAVRVQRDAALDCLGRDQVAKIAVRAPATPQFRVNRIKGVEVKLVDAVKGLAEVIA